MLNFKQFSSMTLFSVIPKKDSEELFLTAGRSLGAVCGILVLESEDGSGFLEKARFGYGEEGFYYSFLARGLGHLETLQNGKSPRLFPATEYPLFSSDSGFAVVSPIFLGEKFSGFLLLEFSGSEDESLWKSYLLAQYFSTEGKENASVPREEFLVIQYLRETFSPFSSEVESGKLARVLRIQGPAKSGKKSLAKYLHRLRGNHNQLLLIETIPDNFGKLEKALQHWTEMAKVQGGIAFSGVEKFSPGQQRIFLEWLEETSGFSVIFLQKNFEILDPYSPFLGILRSRQIRMPAWEEWGPAEKSGVIFAIFREICRQMGRDYLKLDPDLVPVLSEESAIQNLEDLKNVLGNWVWQTQGGEVVGSDQIRRPVEELGASPVGTPDLEDLDLPKSIEALERQKIQLAHRLFSGNQLRMAKALKISRGSLQYKMKNLGLQ
jgi:hypothetical protein